MNASDRDRQPMGATRKMSMKCATTNAWIVIPILAASLSLSNSGMAATTSARSGPGYLLTPVHDDSDVSGGYRCQWFLRPHAPKVATTDFRTLVVGLNGRDYRTRWSGARNTPYEGAYRFTTVINGLTLNFRMIKRFPEGNPEVEVFRYSYLVTALRGPTVVARWNLSGVCGA